MKITNIFVNCPAWVKKTLLSNLINVLPSSSNFLYFFEYFEIFKSFYFSWLNSFPILFLFSVTVTVIIIKIWWNYKIFRRRTSKNHQFLNFREFLKWRRLSRNTKNQWRNRIANAPSQDRVQSRILTEFDRNGFLPVFSLF